MEIQTNSKIDFSSHAVTLASKFDYMPSKHDVLYLRHTWTMNPLMLIMTKNKGSCTSNLSQSCGSCWEGCDIWCCDMWCCDIWWWWLYWCHMIGPIEFQRICISLLGLFQGLAMLKFSPKHVLGHVIIIITNIIIKKEIQAKEGAFWGLQHAQILTKVCIKLGNDENLHILE